MEIDTIGIDLGKTVFHLVGLNRAGEVVVRRKCSRLQLLRFAANLRVRLIGMESCGGSHFLGRALREQGHEVRLMPAQYVKPYVKTNKNDYGGARGTGLQLTPRRSQAWKSPLAIPTIAAQRRRITEQGFLPGLLANSEMAKWSNPALSKPVTRNSPQRLPN